MHVINFSSKLQEDMRPLTFVAIKTPIVLVVSKSHYHNAKLPMVNL
jgi:hypothetical protein